MKELSQEDLINVNGGAVLTEKDLAGAYQDNLDIGQTVKIAGVNGDVGTIAKKREVGKHTQYFVRFLNETSPDWYFGSQLIKK